MAIRPEELLEVLGRADHPLGVRELMRAGGMHPGRQTEVKRALRELLRRGQVAKEGKRFLVRRERHREERPLRGAPRRAERLEGILRIHRDGFGFVSPSSGEGEDLYVSAAEARRALDNDRVLVEVVPGQRGRKAGRLVRVVERRRQFLVGTYRERARAAWVEPQDQSVPEPVRVPHTQLARDGDLVKVRLGVGAGLFGPGVALFGEVAGSLGKPGEASAEVLSIAYAQGFHDEFPPEVMDEADAVPTRVSEQEARSSGRRDLRRLPLVTIDGEDARDFDDAICVEELADGFRLFVAVADVAHYVRPGSALDDEAARRGTSVYLPDRVLPMLPERLSNGICSLRPDEDRLCLVAEILFDRHATRRSYRLYPAVMRSHARCTYDEVHRVLSGELVPGRTPLRPHFERAMALARALMAMRERRGALDFDLPETRVELDAEGRPTRMVRRERLESHRLVEECMLAANEAVARFFQDEGLPSVYRYHAHPDPEKLATFIELARVHGFSLPSPERLRSKDLNAFLEQLEGHREQRALNQLLLRSMMQAVYSAESVGHYGLAAEHYLHFTSPIRRYPDLLVHRLLWRHWGRPRPRLSPKEAERETAELQGRAGQCSERERAAMQVEREVVSYYAAVMMKDRVGEELDGIVSALTDFGMFVELESFHVEGLVRGESVEPRFELDTRAHALVFGSGRRVRVGDRLRVRLVSVSVARRQLDLEPVRSAGAVEGRPRGRPAAKARPRGPGRAR